MLYRTQTKKVHDEADLVKFLTKKEVQQVLQAQKWDAQKEDCK